MSLSNNQTIMNFFNMNLASQSEYADSAVHDAKISDTGSNQQEYPSADLVLHVLKVYLPSKERLQMQKYLRPISKIITLNGLEISFRQHLTLRRLKFLVLSNRLNSYGDDALKTPIDLDTASFELIAKLEIAGGDSARIAELKELKAKLEDLVVRQVQEVGSEKWVPRTLVNRKDRRIVELQLLCGEKDGQINDLLG